MSRTLYISNISTPYRSAFFEELGKKCNLTVLYERKKSSNRNSKWANISAKSYNINYLNGKNLGNENSFDLEIISYLKKYDNIIVGCYNSPIEIFAILYMRLTRKKYWLNIDGEIFKPHNFCKRIIRDFVLRGAHGYLCAGVTNVQHIKEVTKNQNIIPFYFSSLTEKEVEEASQNPYSRNKTVFCVGQFEDYKGLDVLLNAAKLLPDISFKIVGMVKKAPQFSALVEEMRLDNITIVPFIEKEKLLEEYQKNNMLVLPSRQECWGLVINEGAACGIPIVSTYGSGAAIEFLDGKYSKYLAKSGDAIDLAEKINELYNASENEIEEYSKYLKEKSKEYSIEKMVEAHLKAINK